ncbi:hypothetical protein G6F46_014029 [Rhizopus delemar]|nr:hypothetical protein G6F46_014029 [Rhizopus delemar]
MPAWMMPSAVSRCCVTVVLRVSTSTSPDCSAVKRCCEFSGTTLILSASPKTAAAMARQRSTSSPCHLPCASGAEKPAKPVVVPHATAPRWRTTSSVAACAPCAAAIKSAAPTNPFAMFMTWIPVMPGAGTRRGEKLIDMKRPRQITSAYLA